MLDSAISWFSSANNILAFSQLLTAAVTAVATIALWRVTRVLAVETAKLAQMTSQPFVVCNLESSASSAVALNLTLRNTGNATAFDIKLELLPALPKYDGSPAEDDTSSIRELSVLAPGLVHYVEGVMSRDIPNKKYAATISWANRPNAAVRETLSYNFKPKDGFRGGWGTKGLHQIAGTLEKISDSLSKR